MHEWNTTKGCESIFKFIIAIITSLWNVFLWIHEENNMINCVWKLQVMIKPYIIWKNTLKGLCSSIIRNHIEDRSLWIVIDAIKQKS